MKKNICFIVSVPYTANFVKNHLDSLSKEYNIYLVANINDANKDVLKLFNFFDYKSIPINRNINILYDLKSVYQLYKYFKLMKFDAIHSITPKAGLLSALAGKLSGTPNRIHIFTGQVWATKTGVSKLILKTLDKIISNFSTHVLVDGNSQRDFLRTEKVIKSDEGLVLGAGSICGVDLKQYAPNLDMRHTIRNELNLSDNVVVYLFLGRLNKEKGVIELAKAFNKLSLQNKNVFLLWVGFDEDNMLSDIDEIIQNKSAYHFAGSTYTPEIYYQSSDVFCLPSYREGFGMSVIEASACKIPVICSDAYGLMDTIIDNKTGLRHKVKDIDGLYNQMKKLSQNSQLRDSLGERGHTYIHDNFSSEIITNEWIKFYNKLLC